MAILIAFAAMMLIVSSTPTWAAAPIISNLNDAAIAEQIETVIDSDVSISNPDGTGFGSGYIEFSLANSGSNDDLNIRSSGSPNSEGEISVSGSDVYIGTGSDKTKIATIDATYNGQNGQKLRVNFVAETASLPTNNDFETGTMNGWTIDTGVTSVSDTSELRAVLSNLDFSNTGDSESQQASIDTDSSQGTYSLKIYNTGTTASGYGNIWGPSTMSSSFSASAGNKILFDWKATQTSDYYIAYALLIDNQHGTTTVLFADEGLNSGWQTQEVLVSTTSNNLQFKFILGSYDYTGGKAVGASMHIDNIRALSLADSVVTSLSRAVTHIYTDDSPSGSVVSGRTLTINTQDKDSESASSTAAISVYGDSPSFNSGSSFSVDENETSLTKVLYDTQADNGDGGSNDQDIAYSCIGGDGQNLFNIDSDDGEVRLNSNGVSTLDYETITSYTLQIQADDGQAIDNTADLTVAVNVNDVNEAPYAPTSLQCEGQTNPAEVSDFTPEFGWTFSDQNIGNTQSAYQILVATSSANLTSDNGDRWDSGKVTSSSPSNISYAGSSLAPCTTHHWKVKTWDNHDAEGSYSTAQTFTTAGPTLTLGSVGNIIRDWGINFSLNHSVTVTNANASNMNVTYNISWIEGCAFGTVNKDATKWHNQTRSNSTVQKITVKVDATTTTGSATNDSETFNINITRRAIIITADPVAPQSVNPNTTFRINGSAEGEYGETFMGIAYLIRDGSIIDNKTITDGNANFSRTEPEEGTFNFSIKFYNKTHYNNATTGNAIMHIVDDTPPASITGLDNLTTEQSRIHWTWTDPTDADFAEVMIYLNGTFKANVSKGVRNYTATGLTPDTNYTIGMHTVDDKGNVNRTWVNDTARTLPFSGLQRIKVMPASWTLNINESMNFNATGFDHNDDSIDPLNLTFTWYTIPSGVGTLNSTTGAVVDFTALHAGRTEVYAVNGSISSAIDSVWITVNAPTETGNVANGTGNATSGNSTATVWLENGSISGMILIEEIGDPLNKTEDRGNMTGLGATKSVKGANVTVTGSIEVALNDAGGYVHIGIEYNESQIGGIDENTLYIYKFVNGTGWVKMLKGNPSYCIANGRNTTANYVWVNVTNCSKFLLTGIPAATPQDGGGDRDGTYPPGWFETPTPAVTATKAPATAASANATATPPGESVTPAPTKAKPAAAKATTPAAEATTAEGANEGAPGFTAVFVIAGMLAVAYAMMRRRG
jgi:PGF-CTERM protein